MAQIFEDCEIESSLKSILDNDVTSTKKKHAKRGKRYYEARHDILDYRIFYYNGDNELVEDTVRSNIKIPHAFYTELIDQKTAYILSGFDMYSDDDNLNDELQKYFDDNFKSELAQTIEDTSKIGFSYMYAQYGKDERTHFKSADGMGIVEVINPITEELIYVVNYYVTRVNETNKDKVIAIEVNDKDQTYYYLLKDNAIKKDVTKPINPRPHILWKQIENNREVWKGKSFGFIPFFRLDNNMQQFSDLHPIKHLIDDYDMMSCGLSNNLQDIAEGVYVVKGFQGDNFNELQQNIKAKKIVGVGEQGDVDIKTIDVPYEARKTKLDLDETNIYRYGMGFNSSQIGDGNITNVVIKSRYSLLDLKCQKMIRRLRSFLQNILEIVIDEINNNDSTSYDITDVKVDFKPEIMANELDNAQVELTKAQAQQVQINTILNAAAQLPAETVLQEICTVLDLNYDEVSGKLKNLLETRKSINELSDEILNLEENINIQGNASNTQEIEV